MATKNAFLEQLRAQAEAKAAAKAETHVEMDLMAMLLMVHDKFKVGPGRADGCINSFLAWKIEIAEAIDKEWKEDLSETKELVTTPRDLAKRLQEILGPDGWKKARTLFPFLRDYW